MKNDTAKKLSALLALVMIATLLRAGPAPGLATLHIGISPYLDFPTSQSVLTQVRQLLLVLPPGLDFRVENGVDGSVIASGTSPVLPFDSLAARARALAVPRVAVQKWLTTARTGSLAGTAALNPPVYLRSVAEHPGPGRQIVLLIGSALYRNEEEPGFNFPPDRLPATGQLGLGEDATPFGCTNRRGLLQGVTVHWCYPSPGEMPFEAYANAARSWWRIWLAAQSGTPGEFGHDWVTITQELFAQVAQPSAFDWAHQPVAAGQPEMLVVPKRIGVDQPSPARVVVAPAPAPAPPVAAKTVPAKTDPAPGPVVPELKPRSVVVIAPPPAPVPVPGPAPAPPATASPVEIPAAVNHTVSSIGLIWQGDSSQDLDLSIRVKPGSTKSDPGELYWNTPPKNTAGPKVNELGRYLRDIRSGGSHEYEWIELAQQADARELTENLEVWCNHFDGVGPVTFTAVIVDHGRIVSHRELTVVGSGDKRGHAGRREKSDSWLLLPVGDMLANTTTNQSAGM